MVNIEESNDFIAYDDLCIKLEERGVPLESLQQCANSFSEGAYSAKTISCTGELQNQKSVFEQLLAQLPQPDNQENAPDVEQGIGVKNNRDNNPILGI